MAYPEEKVFTEEEINIIFRIRQLIGDQKEIFVDDIANISLSKSVSSNGTLYQLAEFKGWPVEVNINGLDYTQLTNPQVLSYKFLKFEPVTSGFPDGPLTGNNSLTVLYNHFRHSDLEILNTYDAAALSYLVDQCGLSAEDLGTDLLILATAYILLTSDLNVYIKDAISIRDSDSEFNTTARATGLRDLLKVISDKLTNALSVKMRCKMMSLQVKKIE